MSIGPDDDVRRLAIFDRIFIPHRRYKTLYARLRSLLRQTYARIDAVGGVAEDSYSLPTLVGGELWIFRLQGPTGATKTTSLLHACHDLAKEFSGQPQPILRVTLDSNIKSIRQLQVRILKEFGHELANTVMTARDYSADVVNDAILVEARSRGTGLVVLDEVHNILPIHGAETALVMAKALRSLVNKGVFSLVLSGTEAMSPLFENPELLSRTKPQVDFCPAEPRSEMPELFAFTSMLCSEMVRCGVIDAPFDPLETEEELALLFDMTNGTIGLVSRLFRMALEHAFAEEKTSIDWEDLVTVYGQWRTGQGTSRISVSKGATSASRSAVKAILGTEKGVTENA